MQIPNLFGYDMLLVVCIAAPTYFLVGLWLFWKWATRDDTPIKTWRWGDPPRRGRSVEERIFEHLGGVAVFLSICVFGLRGLGFG